MVDKVLRAKAEWRHTHGAFPARVYVSCAAAHELQRSASRDVCDAFSAARFGDSVMGMEWHEDPELVGESFRFE